MMFDERDADCPECGEPAAWGVCRCGDGDWCRPGTAERMAEREQGAAKTNGDIWRDRQGKAKTRLVRVVP